MSRLDEPYIEGVNAGRKGHPVARNPYFGIDWEAADAWEEGRKHGEIQSDKSEHLGYCNNLILGTITLLVVIVVALTYWSD